MKKIRNGYTRTKLNGVYANNIPMLPRTILTGFLFILEKEMIHTGEPAIVKDKKMYGFYTCYSTFLYDWSTDEIVIHFNETFSNKNPNKVVVKRYKNLDNEVLSDLRNCLKENRKTPTIETINSRIEGFRLLDEDWNSYRCNPMSHDSVDVAKEFIHYIFPKINHDEVDLHPYPVADGGNEVRRPDAKSRSTVSIELENGDRQFEVEIDKDGVVSVICFEHVYDDITYESKGLDWPEEYLKFGDEYVITDFKNDPLILWAIDWIHYK